MLEYSLRCVHTLCRWQHQFAIVWYTALVVKTVSLSIIQRFIWAICDRYIPGHLVTQVVFIHWRLALATLSLLMISMVYDAQARPSYGGQFATYSLPWAIDRWILSLPLRFDFAHSWWYGATLCVWVFSLLLLLLCSSWQDSVCYWAWDLAILCVQGTLSLLRFGPHSGPFYNDTLPPLASAIMSPCRALWHSVHDWPPIFCTVLAHWCQQLCIYTTVASTDQDRASVAIMYFLLGMSGEALQPLLTIFILTHLPIMQSGSCINFSLISAVPVVAMERYTPDAPEPKRSWDQRPALPGDDPRRLPHLPVRLGVRL